MQPRFFPGLITTLALLGGCGDKTVATDSDATTDGTTSTSTTSASSTTDTSGTSTDTASGGATGTATSGGAAGCAACGADEYCDWVGDACGPPESGVCTPLPDGCDAVYMPVCGCDGEVYSNACEAARAKVDVAAADTCTPPEGFFPCGFTLCEAAFNYCQRDVSDTGDPDTFFCNPLPEQGCDPPSCACLAMVPCGDLCEPVGPGFVVTCPGG